MNPATIIQNATAEGVGLRVLGGSLKASGDRKALNHWLPIIRENKPAIVAALQSGNASPAIDREAFEERATIREYDGDYSRDDAELLAAWEMTQALFARLTAREWLARYASERLPEGDSAENYPVAQIPPGNDFWLERERHAGNR